MGTLYIFNKQLMVLGENEAKGAQGHASFKTVP